MYAEHGENALETIFQWNVKAAKVPGVGGSYPGDLIQPFALYSAMFSLARYAVCQNSGAGVSVFSFGVKTCFFLCCCCFSWALWGGSYRSSIYQLSLEVGSGILEAQSLGTIIMTLMEVGAQWGDDKQDLFTSSVLELVDDGEQACVLCGSI